MSKGRRIRKKSHSIFRVSIPVPIFMEIFTHLYISFISLYFRTVRDIIHSVLKQGHISHAAWRTGKRERVQPGKGLWNQFCQTSRFASWILFACWPIETVLAFPPLPFSPPLPFRHYVVSFNVIIKVDAVRKPIDDWPTTRWQCITATGQTKKMIKVDG